MNIAHLGWIPAGATVGFGASFLFGDLIALPIDLYYLIVWRGVIYGAVDGLLLFAFPWIVIWRAFDSTIGAVPTLVTADPVASPLSHVFPHVTAVPPDTEERRRTCPRGP